MIYLLLVLLLMPSVGVAGEMVEYTTDGEVFLMPQLDPDTDETRIDYYGQFTIPAYCIKRMREAMRVMDDLLSLNLLWRSPGFGKESLKTYGYSEVRQWDTTMKECVK